MSERLSVKEKVLSAIDQLAAETRERLVGQGIFSIKMISSPGSGKTTLLERTVDLLKDSVSLAVVAGDVQTRNDAERLLRHDVPVEEALENALSINPDLEVFSTSSYTGEGLEVWAGWLADQAAAAKESAEGAGS